MSQAYAPPHSENCRRLARRELIGHSASGENAAKLAYCDLLAGSDDACHPAANYSGRAVSFETVDDIQRTA